MLLKAATRMNSVDVNNGVVTPENDLIECEYGGETEG